MDSSPLSNRYNTVACRSMIRHSFALHELSPLIKATLSNEDEDEMIRALPAERVQMFVDAIDEVRPAPSC